MNRLNLELCIYAELVSGETTEAFNGDQSHLCTEADSTSIVFKSQEELNQSIKDLSNKFLKTELTYEDFLKSNNSIKCELNPSFIKNDYGMKNMTLEVMDSFNVQESDITWKAEVYLLDENFDHFANIDDLNDYVK